MKETEIWRPVVGYEGLYEVSSLGRVKCPTITSRIYAIPDERALIKDAMKAFE